MFTRALKTNSLNADRPRSGFKTARRLLALHCLTGSRALLRSTARSSDPDRGRVEAKWSLNPDPRSASDADPGFRVESPHV